MQLYYHVTHLIKGRECRFDFSYLKGGGICIIGRAEVDYGIDGKTVKFDGDSCKGLSDTEKNEISSTVLKHLVE